MTTVVSPGAGGRIDLGLQGSAVVITRPAAASAPRQRGCWRRATRWCWSAGCGDMLRQTAGAIEESGGQALCVPADLADADSPARIIASALESFGRAEPGILLHDRSGDPAGRRPGDPACMTSTLGRLSGQIDSHSPGKEGR
jgi:hypothetical protein